MYGILDKITIDNNGNIGIGTSKPASSLDASQRTDGIIIPSSNSNPNNAIVGMLRLDLNSGVLQVYRGAWLTYSNPVPSIQQASSYLLGNIGDSSIITGTNFEATQEWTLIGADGYMYYPTVTFNSSSSVTITRPNVLPTTNSPYTLLIHSKITGLDLYHPLTFSSVPPYPSNPWAQLEASKLDLSNNSNVSSWGIGIAFTQATTINQPVYFSSGGYDNKSYVFFNRTNSTFLNAGTQTLNVSTNGGFTAMALIKYTGTAGGWERIFDFGNGQASSNIFLGRNGASQNYTFEMYNPSTSTLTTTTAPIIQDEWAIVACRYIKSSKLQIYKNNTLVIESSIAVDYVNRTLTNTYIGRSNWADAYLNAHISKLFIYDRNLSDAEMIQLYNYMYGKPLFTSVQPSNISANTYYSLVTYQYTFTASASSGSVTWAISPTTYGNINPITGVVSITFPQNTTVSGTFTVTATDSNGSSTQSWNYTISSTPDVISGGTVSDVSGYRLHTFTTNNTLTVYSATVVDFLLVGGGGGGGGNDIAGGGGAGGVIYQTSYTVPTGNYNIQIGLGGGAGSNGGNSVFHTFTAIGGGRGGLYGTYGPNTGGSGGGGAGNATANAITSGAAGTAGQGTSGGNGIVNATGSLASGGGGGGAGGNVEVGAYQNYPGLGGNGLEVRITGSTLYYGAGGAGGHRATTEARTGGVGGGGTGGASGATSGANGSFYGAGGGGSGGGGGTSGSGYQGIFIIKYLNSASPIFTNSNPANIKGNTASAAIVLSYTFTAVATSGVTSYSITPTTYGNINSSTGALTITIPQNTTASGTFTVTATNGNGSSSQSWTYAVQNTAYTSREYPPSTMPNGTNWTRDTNDVHTNIGGSYLPKHKITLSGAAYANGQYIAWSNNEWYWYNACGLFEKRTTWVYSSPGGWSTTLNFSSTVDATNPANVWLKLPVAIVLTSYDAFPRGDGSPDIQGPSKWQLYGSNDNVTYTLLHTADGVTGWTSNVSKNFTVSTSNAYSYFNWRFLRVRSSNNNIVLNEIKLNGYE